MGFSRGTFYKLNLVANKLFGTNIPFSSTAKSRLYPQTTYVIIIYSPELFNTSRV